MDIIIVMKIMFQHHSKIRLMIRDLLDERLIGPLGTATRIPRISTFISTTGSRPRSRPRAKRTAIVTTSIFCACTTQSQQVGTFAVDPGSIRLCLFRFTYLWLRNRQQFWFYPVFIGTTIDLRFSMERL